MKERLFENTTEITGHEGVDKRVSGAVGVRHTMRDKLENNDNVRH